MSYLSYKILNLQTQIPLVPERFNQIDYNSKVLFLGSCFSENIGAKFEHYKFQNTINPFGILFHPIAIEHLITRSINTDYYIEDDLYSVNEQWCCLDAHSKLSKTSKTELLKVLNSEIDATNQKLINASQIIITLGTGWVYRHISSDAIVANCHKIPQKQFLKELLSVEEIKESLDAMITLVESVNPKAKVIFTVSPVRHIKDGFVENTQSKAHLITAIHELMSLRAQSRSLSYFPSYEIMMDELRDYRFYNSDMLHPSDVAIDYIWEKFKTVWFTEECQKTMDEVSAIQKGLSHKPFNPNSEAHQKFISTLNSRIKNLKSIHSHFQF